MTDQLMKFIELCNKNENPPVVVLGSAVNGLSYLRSLCRKDIPVLCMDHNPGYASKSRLGNFILLDKNDTDDIPGEADADRIFSLLKHHGITAVVFGSADEWQVYISRRGNSEKSNFISLAPGLETMAAIVDKQAQYELASGAGINVPKFANAAEVFSGNVKWTDFPAIIKPRWAHIGRGAIGGKALRVETLELLHESLNDLMKEAKVEDYLVQKVISGADRSLFAYLGCYDAEGHEFAFLVKQKLRQYPPFLGDGSYDMTCNDEPIAQAGRKLLNALNYRGLVGIEFKREPDSKDFGLIEINPRTVSTNQLATTAGIDFPWIAYQLALHKADPDKYKKPTPSKGYRSGVAHVNEERDFLTFLERRKKNELGFFEWFASVIRAESFALWDIKDPLPFLSMVYARVTKRLQKVFS